MLTRPRSFEPAGTGDRQLNAIGAVVPSSFSLVTGMNIGVRLRDSRLCAMILPARHSAFACSWSTWTLFIAGRIGELVDAVLRHLDPVADIDLRADGGA
jgi:hypothetical protein